VDQVGFEPTSSRSRGEVTLPYTASNFSVHRESYRRAISATAASKCHRLPRREPPTGPRFAPAKTSPGGKSSRVAGRQPHVVWQTK